MKNQSSNSYHEFINKYKTLPVVESGVVSNVDEAKLYHTLAHNSFTLALGGDNMHAVAVSLLDGEHGYIVSVGMYGSDGRRYGQIILRDADKFIYSLEDIIITTALFNGYTHFVDAVRNYCVDSNLPVPIGVVSNKTASDALRILKTKEGREFLDKRHLEYLPWTEVKPYEQINLHITVTDNPLASNESISVYDNSNIIIHTLGEISFVIVGCDEPDFTDMLRQYLNTTALLQKSVEIQPGCIKELLRLHAIGNAICAIREDAAHLHNSVTEEELNSVVEVTTTPLRN